MSDFAFRADRIKSASNKEMRARERAVASALIEPGTPKQLGVIKDPAKSKAVRCPRRAGKTWLVTRYALWQCLTKPRSIVVVITLTRGTGRRHYWDPIKEINETHDLGAKFHNTRLEVNFDNGSQLFFTGAETVSEVEKLRGGQYDLVIIDECASFAAHLFMSLLDDVLQPALLDRRGTRVLIGTPGRMKHTPFYWATFPGVHKIPTAGEGAPPLWVTVPYGDTPPEGLRRTWSLHTWSLADNTALPHLWEGALENKLDNNWGDDNPRWQVEYLGNWVDGENALVFSYFDQKDKKLASGEDAVSWRPNHKNDTPFGLPNLDNPDWRFVLGCDLGYEDDYAMVIAAYSPTYSSLYFVWDFKRPHLTVGQIADEIKAAQKLVGSFDAIIGDSGGLGKMVLETLVLEHGIPIEKADKHEKFDFIELMNSDFYDGRIKVIDGSDLSRQLDTVQLDLSDGSKKDLARKGKLRILLGQDDHLTDAALYTWRYCYHHFFQNAESTPDFNTPEGYQLWRKQQMENYMSRQENRDPWKTAYFKGIPNERN